jgi:hypothetical protein
LTAFVRDNKLLKRQGTYIDGIWYVVSFYEFYKNLVVRAYAPGGEGYCEYKADADWKSYKYSEIIRMIYISHGELLFDKSRLSDQQYQGVLFEKTKTIRFHDYTFVLYLQKDMLLVYAQSPLETVHSVFDWSDVYHRFSGT